MWWHIGSRKHANTCCNAAVVWGLVDCTLNMAYIWWVVILLKFHFHFISRFIFKTFFSILDWTGKWSVSHLAFRNVTVWSKQGKSLSNLCLSVNILAVHQSSYWASVRSFPIICGNYHCLTTSQWHFLCMNVIVWLCESSNFGHAPKDWHLADILNLLGL